MKTVYRVEARVNGPGSYWVGVLTTTDIEYAEATREQFVEADVPVRVIADVDVVVERKVCVNTMPREGTRRERRSKRGG